MFQTTRVTQVQMLCGTYRHRGSYIAVGCTCRERIAVLFLRDGGMQGVCKFNIIMSQPVARITTKPGSVPISDAGVAMKKLLDNDVPVCTCPRMSHGSCGRAKRRAVLLETHVCISPLLSVSNAHISTSTEATQTLLTWSYK